MARFNIAYKLTESVEGGYVFDGYDRGGETYKGIARKFHPNWIGWDLVEHHKPLERGDVIDNTELEQFVFEFYKEKFWDVINGDLIESQEIANELYDTSVNMGTGTAVRILQRAINLFVDGSISVDGKLGVVTISKMNTLNAKQLLKALNGLQFMKYVEICEKNPTQERFFKGWLKRV